MRRQLAIKVVAAFAALLTLTACSSSANQAGSSTTSVGSPATSNSPPGPQPHNDADTMFAKQMIPHHQQAIQMSDIIIGKQGIDPRVIQLANQIKAAQGPEIQTMQAWLSQWGQSTTPGMPGHSGMPGMPGMSGTMSEQDMQALQNAQGVEASKLFLTQMIQHHQSAITMAQDEIKSGRYPPATALAHSIVTNQQQEINTMQSILASL
ncbi:DUF305 domain-containing protein [Mycobacterium intracellulare]|uniref:DUF305 domain-containing protein n=1 Tax=Mycobacterium intracellulare TaxID=1767 RepID=UPI0006CA9F5C|nr:DUF305 domain-containing protein [Mycobacterium intracellulare]KPN48124.1 hypothetical protein AN933_23655 [Mycobacterium intracellulare subsp. chimaera]